MRNVIKTSGLAVATLALPWVASAQSIYTIFNTFSSLINGLIALLIGVAVIVFFWGLVKYLTKAGDEKSKGLALMGYGLIALFVMLSVYGLIRLLQNTFGVAGGQNIAPPTVQVGTFGN